MGCSVGLTLSLERLTLKGRMRYIFESCVYGVDEYPCNLCYQLLSNRVKEMIICRLDIKKDLLVKTHTTKEWEGGRMETCRD